MKASLTLVSVRQPAAFGWRRQLLGQSGNFWVTPGTCMWNQLLVENGNFEVLLVEDSRSRLTMTDIGWNLQFSLDTCNLWVKFFQRKRETLCETGSFLVKPTFFSWHQQHLDEPGKYWLNIATFGWRQLLGETGNFLVKLATFGWDCWSGGVTGVWARVARYCTSALHHLPACQAALSSVSCRNLNLTEVGSWKPLPQLCSWKVGRFSGL